MNTISQLSHEEEFEHAWDDRGNARFDLPAIDVNRVLARNYHTSEPLTFTRTMLWDMEVRKSWRPDLYIPSVVKEGSASAWGKQLEAGGGESFLRSSLQRLWLKPSEYGLVLEKVHVDPSQQKVVFIGAAALSDRDQGSLHAGTRQPLFHVVHSVGGDELRPLNKWHIVHLNTELEHNLVERFTSMANDVWLPEFIEIYIRTELNIELIRNTSLPGALTA